MRIVVFGAGRMGQTRAHALASAEKVTEIIVANRTPDAAERLAASVGGSSCSIEQALESDADAAIVTVATASHLELLEPLLDRGVAILCEKPLTVDIPGTESLIARARRTGTPLHVGFHRRFDDGFIAARASLAAGELGRIYHARMSSHDHVPADASYIETSGGIFRDLHVHDFDLAAWMFDSPIRSVLATGSVRFAEQYARFGDVDTAVILAELANGVPVVITGTRQSPRGQDVRVELYGTKDCINAGGGAASEPRPMPAAEGHAWSRAAFQTFMERFEGAFLSETLAFVDAVESGEGSLTPPQTALDALRVAEACERSHREQRRVDLP